ISESARRPGPLGRSAGAARAAPAYASLPGSRATPVAVARAVAAAGHGAGAAAVTRNTAAKAPRPRRAAARPRAVRPTIRCRSPQAGPGPRRALGHPLVRPARPDPAGVRPAYAADRPGDGRAWVH